MKKRHLTTKDLSQKRLKELLHYNPKTGIFIWKISKGSIKTGQVAGHISSKGYNRIKIDSRLYRASRLVWLYVKGYFPEHEIDHRDRIKNNDKWENLRHVSHQCNSKNCNLQKNNKSGITGITWIEEKQKWRSRIKTSEREIHLGLFVSKTEAVIARWNAEIKHNFPNCNTISSAYQYLKKEQNQIAA